MSYLTAVIDRLMEMGVAVDEGRQRDAEHVHRDLKEQVLQGIATGELEGPSAKLASRLALSAPKITSLLS